MSAHNKFYNDINTNQVRSQIDLMSEDPRDLNVLEMLCKQNHQYLMNARLSNPQYNPYMHCFSSPSFSAVPLYPKAYSATSRPSFLCENYQQIDNYMPFEIPKIQHFLQKQNQSFPQENDLQCYAALGSEDSGKTYNTNFSNRSFSRRTPEQLTMLGKYFLNNSTPSESDRIKIAKNLGMNPNQVYN